MRKALVKVNEVEAGILEAHDNGQYKFCYLENYHGVPVSLTMPVNAQHYEFNQFPPFFEGLLPEGVMLEALLRKYKLDKKDYFSQLIVVGQDVVGAVTIEAMV